MKEEKWRLAKLGNLFAETIHLRKFDWWLIVRQQMKETLFQNEGVSMRTNSKPISRKKSLVGFSIFSLPDSMHSVCKW